MAYEPNTWSVGDVITAEKMNNIEQGIVDAGQSGGGNGVPFIKVNKEFASGDHYLSFAICEYDEQEEVYVAQSVANIEGNLVEINIYGYNETIYLYSPLPIPPEGLYLIVWGYSTWTYSFEGDIDPNGVTVEFGSTATGHIITGNCTITVSD